MILFSRFYYWHVYCELIISFLIVDTLRQKKLVLFIEFEKKKEKKKIELLLVPTIIMLIKLSY
jgi:hypothetical protein